MPQGPDDESAHISRIAEPHFGLGRMHIHINIFRVEIDKQRRHGMAVPRQKILIRRPDDPVQHSVFNWTAIHEQVLPLCVAAIERWQASKPRQTNPFAIRLNGQRIFPKFSPHNGAEPLQSAFVGVWVRGIAKYVPSIALKRECNICPGHWSNIKNYDPELVIFR